MSHTFPNLQAHPTLTPNPTFQPQPQPLPLTMQQQPPSSTTNTNASSSSTSSSSTNTNNHNDTESISNSDHSHTHKDHLQSHPHSHSHSHSHSHPHSTSNSNSARNHNPKQQQQQFNISPMPPQHPLPLHPPHPSLHPHHASSMRFIPGPPPHPYPHSGPLPLQQLNSHNNHTPDFTQLTASTSSHHPPPLTHENDIVSDTLNASTSNDESNNGIDSNSTHSNTNNNHNKPEDTAKTDDDDQDMDLNNNKNKNNNNNHNNTVTVNQPPFAMYTDDDRLRAQNAASTATIHHPSHAFSSPFPLQPPPNNTGNHPLDENKTLKNNNASPSNPTTAFPAHSTYFPAQIGLNGVMPSPFMPHGQPPPPPHSTYPAHPHDTFTTHDHPPPPPPNNGTTNPSENNPNGRKDKHNQTRVGWQFALLPHTQIGSMNPMFGPGGYLPPDAYMRRPNYGEQGMVDVPHVTQPTDSNGIDSTMDNNGNHSNHDMHTTNNNVFNAIITTPPSINAPLIGTELDIEHGLNTNTHLNINNQHDEDMDVENAPNIHSTTNTKGNNKHNNKSSSTSSSRRSSRSSTRNRKKRDKHHRTHSIQSNGRKRRRRHKDNNNNNTATSTSTTTATSGDNSASKYVSIKQDVEASVKGGAGNGYRMVLDEPVNKSMLSCHQCKNKKTLDRIIVCGHVYRINNTVKTCTKKYCKSCLLRFYLEAPPTDNKDPTWSSWKCPCCRYICCCAWCRKKKAKRLESVSNAIRAEAHRLTPAISLARKLVSESRVNNNNGGSNGGNHNRTHRTRNSMDIPPQI